MLVLALVVLGLFSYFKLPAELNPNVDFGVISVVTTYPGTNPQEMETLITKPIEDSISSVSGLKEIDSTSQQGISTIRCQLYIGTNVDSAAADIRDKVDAVRQQLPQAANSPVVSKRDTSSQPVMYLAMSGDRPSRELRILADNIVKERLAQARDVAAVSVFGGDQREIRVSVNRDRLAAYGITIAQLSQAIQASNVNLAAGYIQKNDLYASVRFIGEFANVDEIKKLWLNLPSAAGSTGGARRSVRLVVFALVSVSFVYRTQSSTVDGRDTVTLAIQKTSDGNTLNACRGVKTQLEAVQKALPSDITFTSTFDASKNVTDNLRDVVTSLFLGALLAILIVYLFLHNFRATVIVAVAIPVCVISTFLPISALGFTLNTMTLLGLSLAIGILIDDSIVVLENIVRHLQQGDDPVTAAIRGRTEIGMAAVTLTLVDLVVFLPIAFMGGIIGQFFRSFGASISIAVAMSLFVSFTLTPMLASRWFRKGEAMESEGEGRRGFAAAFDRGYTRFRGSYKNFLRVCLRHPWVVVAIGNVALVLVFVLVGSKLGFRFAPGQDQNLVAVNIQAPAGSSVEYTTRISNEVEKRIRAADSLKGDVKYILTSVGQSDSTGSGFQGTQYANMQVSLFDHESILDKFTPKKKGAEPLRIDTDAEVAAKVRKLVTDIPGALVQATEVNGFGGGGAPLTINVVGMDFNQLLDAANKVKAYISTIPGVYNTDLSFKASQPEIQIRLDRTRAAAYGLSLQDVSSAVSTAMQGDTTAKFRDPNDSEQYDIRVELNDPQRNSVYEVKNIVVGYQNADPVHLGDVASITRGVGPTRVDRLNRLRQISVTGYLQTGTQIGNVRQKAEPTLKKMFEAANMRAVSYTWGGEAQSLSDEGPFLLSAVFLGIILSYMLMAALFNNMLYPLSVMLTLPQALVGALIALYVANEPLSLIAAIGVIMLNGLAAKNAILMVDYTNTLRSRGYRRIDAILEAAPTRLRPILMTSTAIIGATLPTALALGRGAGFRQSLGVVVVGGVFVSTILTLIVIPCVYLLFDNLSRWLGGLFGRRNRDTEVDDIPSHPGSTNGHKPALQTAPDVFREEESID